MSKQKQKQELERLRSLVKAYRRMALDAYIDGNAKSYEFWTLSAMEVNDRILTMTGFKSRARNARKVRTIYVPVGRN